MKQGLSQGAVQSLALTPQLQLSIRLLQLSSQELEQEVEQRLLTNPFLTRADLTSDLEAFDSAQHQMRDKPNEDDDSAQAVDAADRIGADTATDVAQLEASDLWELQNGSCQTMEFNESPLSWDGDGLSETTPDDNDWGVDETTHEASPSFNSSDSSDRSRETLNDGAEHRSLREHLKKQALHLRLNALEAQSLDYLIDSLDERGFLSEPIDELAACLAQEPQQVPYLTQQLQLARRWLQSLSPAGVGSADVLECLRLQLQERKNQISPGLYRVAWKLLHLPLAQLARKSNKRLAQDCSESGEQIRLALALIARLDPYPASRYQALSHRVVLPDVYVRAVRAGLFPSYTVLLNTDLMPQLMLDAVTLQLLKIHMSRSGKHDTMQQVLQEAKGFIKAMSQRFDTILRVARAIVARQAAFFHHGAQAMRPLVMREIADELGLHESTISRVTTSKYMDTPQGMFEFKYFFSSALGSNLGEQTSGVAVRALIAQWVAEENKNQPLSDSAIAALLGKQGIHCARRTVAKYREGMKIPSAHFRHLG